MATRPLVVIENALLDAMAADPQFQVFLGACLAAISKQASGCARCQKKDPNAYAQAKECIVSLPSASRDRLKTVLQAEQVRVSVLRNGAVRDYAF